MRVQPSLTYLLTRKSTWFNRFSNCLPGSSNWTLAVPPGPAARLRPSDGAMTELGATYSAVISGPGMLWIVVLVWRPHQGSGYTPSSLTCVRNDGATRQKRALGDAMPDRFDARKLLMPPAVLSTLP